MSSPTLRDHISFSEWGCWKKCQYRWKLDYLERRRAEVYSVFFVFGKAVHASLEKLKDPSRKDPPNIDILCQEFEDEFRKRYEEIREKDRKPLSPSDVDSFVAAGRKILYEINSLPQMRDSRVLFVEHELGQKIDRTDDVDIKFKGFIDIVLMTTDKKGKRVVWIVDYKTCSWGWGAEKRRDEDLMAQLRLYKHFFAKEFNVSYKDVRTAFILLKRTPPAGSPVIEWVPFSSGDKTIMRAIESLNATITEMNTTEEYSKNRDECVNKFGEKCPYYMTEHCLID